MIGASWQKDKLADSRLQRVTSGQQLGNGDRRRSDVGAGGTCQWLWEKLSFTWSKETLERMVC